ncbi:site-specific DNA-methyltransferase [Chthonomonas sp.]|uniref:site-specific DNA-methyltransferase n=1 Tax=Chthonomonas sp. TaxID=2282153 RepID=UPI0031B8A0CF
MTCPPKTNGTQTTLLVRSVQENALKPIIEDDKRLQLKFRDAFLLDPQLSRTLVSFQANKQRPIYRWYKYKEAFSAAFVEYILQKYRIQDGPICDPFAGSGTSLFAASALGLDSDGIELLPIGQQIILTKQTLSSAFCASDFETLRKWAISSPWKEENAISPLPEVAITRGAYPEETKRAIERYLAACNRENEKLQTVLRFALLCVLESVSFTRKDGQYLRWDYRSGRTHGKKRFDKGPILPFDMAIQAKIAEILSDTAPYVTQHTDTLFPAEKFAGRIRIFNGSCLELLPTFPDTTYRAIVTSPPYCNRYDYTRTYALELALLGVDEKGFRSLRQQMLSSTVENRIKDLLAMNLKWHSVLSLVDQQKLLQAILEYLEYQKARNALNNAGIPRMVRGYFYELSCVIAECYRILKSGGYLFMVNDNARYAGVSISVDMILSDIAEKLGFTMENILVLPDGKGNSSQQMGVHGRETGRKCVYVWQKPR